LKYPAVDGQAAWREALVGYAWWGGGSTKPYHVICPKYLSFIISGFNAHLGEGTGHHSLDKFLPEFVLKIYL